MYDISSGKVLHRFDTKGYYVKATAFSPDGQLVATGDKNRSIVISNSKTGKAIHRLAGQGRTVQTVGFGRDGASVAWGYTYRYNRINDRGPLEHWIHIGNPQQEGKIVYKGAVAAPDAFIRAKTENETLRLRRVKNRKSLELLKNGKPTHTLKPVSRFYPKILCYTFTPDGRHVIAGGTRGELMMFETKSGKLVRHFYGHSGNILSVAVSPKGNLMVSGSADQTIRVWDLRKGENLFSFFVGSDHEWVAWIPEGFFDASPGGAKYIGYVINRGKEKTADYVSIDQLFDLYYRPDLVALKLEGGHQREIESALEKIKIDAILSGGLPPSIKIYSPTKDGNVNKRDVSLKIGLTDRGGGIGKIVYRINGVTIGTEKRNRGIKLVDSAAPVVVEKQITLQPGDNIITVSAYNNKNEIESKPASITLQVRDAISEKPSLYVLAIGINHYRDHALKLSYSVPDALALGEEMKLRGSGLFETINIITIVDKQATSEGIERTFETLSKEIKSNDLFIFYVAGHGLNLDGRYHFLPWELVYQNEDSVRINSITQDKMQHLLAMIPALKSVVLLDTCNSGAFTEPASRGLAEKTAIDKLIRSTGRATIAASSDSQVALEGYQGHGVFTYVLLQGLKGEADKKGNKNGEISVNELAEYVSEKVPEITYNRWGYEQFPMQNLQGRSFPIALVE